MRKIVRKKYAKHIDEFRTADFRVFYASPYFNIDLIYEIRWNRDYIKKLRAHKEKPLLFHRQYSQHKTEEEKKRHFREHVIESIPFHEKILDKHKQRLKTILNLMPKKKYQKIVGISLKHGGTPEYFVYNKATKELFFVAEHLTEERKHWIHLVKYRYKLADVIMLG
jgi:hypothetical protein